MSEPPDASGHPPPENPFALLDAREELFTASLQHADRMVNTAAAVRLQLMLVGFDAMLLEEQAQTGQVPRPDDPVVTGFLMHQANELRVTRSNVQRRLEAARVLRNSMPKTWEVFTNGLASEDAAIIVGGQAIGLAPQHFAVFDEAAVELVQSERATAVERKLADLRDELEPDLTTELHLEAANRRTVRARATRDGQAVLEIHSTAADIAAAYDRIRKHAVAAHGREGECRTLGALMADCAVDAVLTGVMRGPEEDGPSYPFERLGDCTVSGDVTRKLIDATIIVVIPTETGTGVGNAPAKIAGMGSIDPETARTLVAHTQTWTRAVVDPVDDVILRFDSHERYIPAGLKRLLHLRQPTCGCGCGLPAHRSDWAHGAGSDATPKAAWRPCDGDDHVQRFEHDGRTRHQNLQLLCRRSHQAKDAGFADVFVGDDGVPVWRNKWGGVQKMQTAMRIRTIDDSDVAPF